ncbi:PREDICTED: uncharacterized protein LOC109152136 [Ipomoea nil]|uniref:uncharacterized protein LOC109152136 n=1 Tax=Ipomoea nil TaxID=35883 RepID=UPI00090174BB|nr:PREDICTED: uncharacterized protein LOC109152136 [Ipomoea nil]
MKDEEEFSLEWIGTQDVYEALRLETIKRVYSYKVTHRTLGKEKVPICIELNKPPLDPAFVEEMKEFRYALLLSKVKTELERTHQNDPTCNVSGLKDDEGREIDHEDERVSENESGDANSDSNENADEDKVTDENSENEENDEDDDDKSGDEQDGSHVDDGDDDDDEGKADNNTHDDDSDDDDNDDGNSDYDSESPIIGNTEDIPERSPAPRSSPPKEDLTRELPLAMLPPLANTARDDNMDASPRDENREASPHAPDQAPGMDYLSPEHIMHQMLNTVFTAELIHKQYLHHREKDSRNIADLSAKVDRMMEIMSRPQPNTSIPNTQYRLAHELSQQRVILNKITKEQHVLKHAHFGLKERVDLACTKIDLGHDNMFRMVEYQLTMFEYIKDVLIAVQSLTRFSDTPCDDAKKGEKDRKDDDKDEDKNRSPPRRSNEELTRQ